MPPVTKAFLISRSFLVIGKLKIFLLEIWTGNTYKMIKVLVLNKNGECEHKNMTRDQFVSSVKEHRLPARDLRMILKAAEARKKIAYPALMPRPSSKCFIFDMEHIKLLCFKDSCMILNTEDKAAQIYVAGLKDQFRRGEDSQKTSDSPLNLEDVTNLDF